jgi:hypothetical protein
MPVQGMVWIRNVGMRPAYVCDSCGHGYDDPVLAFSCEGYCKESGSPSPEMTKMAVVKP